MFVIIKLEKNYIPKQVWLMNKTVPYPSSIVNSGLFRFGNFYFWINLFLRNYTVITVLKAIIASVETVLMLRSNLFLLFHQKGWPKSIKRNPFHFYDSKIFLADASLFMIKILTPSFSDVCF